MPQQRRIPSIWSSTLQPHAMGSWLHGLWSVLSAVFGMMLDVAQFWKQVSDPFPLSLWELSPPSHRNQRAKADD